MKISISKLTDQEVDDLTLAVYKRRCDDEWPGNADRQIEKHGEEKVRRFSRFYRPSVVATLIELGLHDKPVRTPPRKPKEDDACS